MDLHYPPGPAAVPADLTAPTSAYKRHAWLAMLGLAVFIALYFALSAWFAWTSWRLLGGMFSAGGEFELMGFIVGICAAFLAVFMLKALFFIQHRYEIEDIEISRQDEPQLFEFIDRLADEARAPRAHKVYLSPRVNAAVFYDLSLLNLIIPSKKNLEIGLGLVNVLSLGELKAVLAHEFGHFAQRSMAVGRWVYIAQQIAGHVVARRDALDRLLQQLSRIDLRVAWIGWVLSIIVWSIRSMMDVLFRAVLLAQRALSRQMEFQADLVAVSLTGSDALINALHRLNAADDAWDKTLSFAGDEANHKRGVTDLFAVHARIIERMREILGQPTYGIAPPLPSAEPAQHRVFKSELAQPPRMWLTHPPSADREHNAKQRYVAAPVDERSAWALFREPQKVKEQMSAHIFRRAETEQVPMAKSLERLEKDYGRPFLDRRYRGIYLSRSPVRHVKTVAELYGPPVPSSEIPRALESLYPESLAQRIEELNEKLEQKHSLVALRDQVAQAPGGIIRHNGQEIRRSELPRVIAELERETATVRGAIEAHDRDCRTVHLCAARTLQKGWPEYLQGLAAVLHYADHSVANLRDAQGYVSNIYRVVTADGRVSSAELARLIAGCQELYRPLRAVYAEATQLNLDRTLLRRLEVEDWGAMLEEFKLPGPSNENISDWFNVIDGWIGASLHALGRLRTAALEQLLLAENQVAKFVREQLPAADAPPASSVPRDYGTLLPGKERPLQKRLDWWDRFQTADGALPMVARSVVALGIVGSVIALGGYVGEASLTIYNSLARPVVVEVAGKRISANPNRPITLDVPASGLLKVRTVTAGDEVIETFDEPLHGANAHYVYNVAGAAPLIEWTAVYTSGRPNNKSPRERPIGALRWSTTRVDHVFEEPPRSIQVKNNADGYRRVLSASEASPWNQVDLLKDEKDRTRVIRTHARWDDTSSPYFLDWLQLASSQPDFDELFAVRMKESPGDIGLMRFEQDSTTGDEHDAVCERHRAQAAADPSKPDLQYLSIRCMGRQRGQQEAFIAAQVQWPKHSWLALGAAASYAETGDYVEAAPLYEQARKSIPSMRDYLAIQTARMRRLNATDSYRLDDLAKVSQHVAMFAAIEAGTDLQGTPLEAFAELARGDLEQAARKSKSAGDGRARVVRLIAASDGATDEMIEEAFALPVEPDPDLDSLVAMYGLASRLHRDPAPYATPIAKAMGEDFGPVKAFIETVRNGGNPHAARAALPSMEFNTRLWAINAAVVTLGDRAPAAWRDEVSRALFVGERQYIGAPKRTNSPETSARSNPGQEPRDSRAARIIRSPVQ